MSDQLDITKLTAEEVAELYPKYEDSANPFDCDAMSGDAYNFWCTRSRYHAGPHVAWGSTAPYAIWYTGKPVKLLFDE